jgi:hypothetical protein
VRIRAVLSRFKMVRVDTLEARIRLLFLHAPLGQFLQNVAKLETEINKVNSKTSRVGKY